MSWVRLRGVTLTRTASGSVATDVLHDVDLSIADGEFALFHGPSGSGKSTLLHAMAGLLAPRLGSVERGTGRLGWVPQEAPGAGRFPLSATEVAEGRGGRERVAAARAWLDRLGLSAVRTRRFANLSGGQRRRVLLARALAESPSLLLLDEPTSALDSESAGHVWSAVAELVRAGTTVICVSHDPPPASVGPQHSFRVEEGTVRERAWTS